MINNENIDDTAKKLTKEIQCMSNYKNLYNEIQRIVASSAVKKDNFKSTLLEALKNNGGPLQSSEEKKSNVDLNYLKKAQIQWERRIHKSLNSMCNELNIPLARIRPSADKDELTDKWNELSTFDIDLSSYRPLYAPKDFLEVLFSVHDPAVKKQINEPKWEFSHIQIQVKTLEQLRTTYAELAQGVALLGVNNDMPAAGKFVNLEAERTDFGEKVLSSNHAPIAQEFLKRGAPRALRGRLWSLVLGSVVKDSDRKYYEELKELVLQYDIMVDKLIIKDVQLTASNDDQYFVFEDVLYKTMLCFSRDSEVLAPVTTDRSAGGQVIHAILQGKPAALENTLVFPPSGVIPFHGFTMYATPFCYLYDDPCSMYFTFRAFYLRYWLRLHTVSSHEQGIVALCLLFERLLHGHLPPEQLLYLWDLILGYDSLEIIPLLAVTILSFRKENLLQVNNLVNVEAILADLSSLKVMPLLQLALLKE
ncbi:Similar to TBC1D19: TBC1 domain family member 19 (Homo sapiens) [Cotesia congregata]|uniref:Similar to TBC1D19: TBC1 domain family member 19 (Homo sapiens) n=1 Tax=Cotesia congregata TaxID=51543 RepID=A0A8J2HKC5_COTCN|nr:Similar to TBC1D19: TBC1 domain family member 19 (Homo sapiens) [Cotesia congregata]